MGMRGYGRGFTPVHPGPERCEIGALSQAAVKEIGEGADASTPSALRFLYSEILGNSATSSS